MKDGPKTNKIFPFILVAGLEAQVQESSKDLYWF
jgi:hypothetical protein